MIHYNQCPVCNDNSIAFAFPVKDHSISGEEFEVWKCSKCSLHFTQNIPEQEHIGEYYQSENYISHSDTKAGLINKLYHAIRNYTLKNKRKLIVSFTALNKGELLDIGCGTGAFLNEMKMNGWSVTGIEADESTRQRAFNNYKIAPLEPPALYSLQKRFNAITMWHVLEHVHELHEYIRECKRLLDNNGVLFIAVPNFTSLDAKHYRSMWAAWDVPRHLYHFNPQSMAELLRIHGMRIDAIKPMWFDSFYVSMLSEKYATGKSNLFRSFWNGFKSNFSAMRNKKKCSSLIYIIRSNSA